MTRQQAIAKVWSQTHRDFKGKIDGVKTVMVLRQGGSTVVPLTSLTEAELAAKVKDYAPPGMFSLNQLAELKAAFAKIETIDPCEPTYGKTCAKLDAMSDAMLKQVALADIKFLSALARNRVNARAAQEVA